MSSDVYIQRYDYIKKIVNQTTQWPKEKKGHVYDLDNRCRLKITDSNYRTSINSHLCCYHNSKYINVMLILQSDWLICL